MNLNPTFGMGQVAHQTVSEWLGHIEEKYDTATAALCYALAEFRGATPETEVGTLKRNHTRIIREARRLLM